jgi:AmiR/NasT family two-component response regulator
MRIVITDKALRQGRQLAGAIERMLPNADVLLYDESHEALAGIAEHRPDVVFVAPAVGAVEGPEFVAQVCALQSLDATVVGLVDAPDADWSQRYVEAGADLVVQRPVDDVGLRVAMRQRAGGVPR